jgi:hypothetical protein
MFGLLRKRHEHAGLPRPGVRQPRRSLGVYGDAVTLSPGSHRFLAVLPGLAIEMNRADRRSDKRVVPVSAATVVKAL